MSRCQAIPNTQAQVRELCGQDNRVSAAVMIDWENVAGMHLNSVLEQINEVTRIGVVKAYANWLRYPNGMSLLAKQGVELIQTAGLSCRKNSADMQLAVDAVELIFTCPHLQTLVLISGDRDFVPLVRMAKRRGLRVWGFGYENSTSAQLQVVCDRWDSISGFNCELFPSNPLSINAGKGFLAGPEDSLPEITQHLKLCIAEAFKLACTLDAETVGDYEFQSVRISQFFDCLRRLDLTFDVKKFCGRSKRTYIKSAQRLVDAGLVEIDVTDSCHPRLVATKSLLAMIGLPKTSHEFKRSTESEVCPIA